MSLPDPQHPKDLDDLDDLDEPEGLDEGEESEDEDLEDERFEDRGFEDDDAFEAEIVAESEAFDAIEVRPSSLPPLPKGSGSGIAKRDPLQAYMRDVQRYPLLNREDEHDLAVRYADDGDVEAAARLVTSNLRLVVKIAYDYRRAYRNILDLIQEGNIGLMQAVKKYDPYKGVKLSSYAAWWIRAYILRFILNNHRLVKVGTTQAQRKLFFNLKKEKAKLSAMGIEPTAAVIAERLDVKEKDVVQMERRLGAGELSLDAPVGAQSDGRPTTRMEMIPSDGGAIDEVLAEEELGEMFSRKIHEYGATLEGKEKVIFDERLVAEDPMTLQELGDRFGVSRERVRQIEKRLQGKLKRYLEQQLGEAVRT